MEAKNAREMARLARGRLQLLSAARPTLFSVFFPAGTAAETRRALQRQIDSAALDDEVKARLMAMARRFDALFASKDCDLACFFGLTLAGQQVFFPLECAVPQVEVALGRAFQLEKLVQSADAPLLLLLSRRTLTIARLTAGPKPELIFAEKVEPPKKAAAGKRRLGNDLEDVEGQWLQAFAERLVGKLRALRPVAPDGCFVAATASLRAAVWTKECQAILPGAQAVEVASDNNELTVALERVRAQRARQRLEKQAEMLAGFTGRRALPVYGLLHTLRALADNALATLFLDPGCAALLAVEGEGVRTLKSGETAPGRHCLDVVAELMLGSDCELVLLDSECEAARAHAKNYGGLTGLARYAMPPAAPEDCFPELRDLLF